MTENKRDPTTTSQLFLQIDKSLLTGMIRPKAGVEGDLDAETLADFATHLRPRFTADVIWVIDVTRIKRVMPEARDPLVQLFKSFLAAKGREIKIASAYTFVCSAFQIAAMKAGLKLTSFKDMGALAASLDTTKSKT